MSLRVITFATTLQKHKGGAGPARKVETAIKEESERSPVIKQDTIRNLFTHPLDDWPDWRLEDFELNYCPYRYTVNHIGTKLAARSIGERRENADLEFSDLCLNILLEMLENANLISNASQADLTHRAEHGRTADTKSNDDLQLAVGWHYRRGKIFTQINIMTQDNWGQRSPRPLSICTNLWTVTL